MAGAEGGPALPTCPLLKRPKARGADGGQARVVMSPRVNRGTRAWRERAGVLGPGLGLARFASPEPRKMQDQEPKESTQRRRPLVDVCVAFSGCTLDRAAREGTPPEGDVPGVARRQPGSASLDPRPLVQETVLCT